MIRCLAIGSLALLWLVPAQVSAQEIQCVATEIEMHPDKRITSGDDIIVYGTGGSSGVDYIIPSEGDTTGRGIPDGAAFHAASFAVAGKKVALVNNFSVTLYDTSSGTSIGIPVDELRLTTVPSRTGEARHMASDGDWIVCRSDKSTADKRFIKVLDVRDVNPKLISFKHNPPVRQANFITHVLVSSEAGRVVAATHEAFYVYEISRPNQRPVEVKVPDGIADVPPGFDGNYILFKDRKAFPNTTLLDLSAQEFVQMPINPSLGTLSLSGGSFAYFANTERKDTVGNSIRCVYGSLSDIEAIQSEQQIKFINGRTANHGAFGYGETVAIASDGQTWFLAGRTSIGSGEYVQVSCGGEFHLLSDPLGQDEHGCFATDISLCNKTLSFKTKGKDHRLAYVGYAILE